MAWPTWTKPARNLTIWAPLVLMATAGSAVQPTVNPTVSFGDRTIVASGMTPKGQVVWFGVMRDPSNGTLDWSHHEEITSDQSGTGTVQLDIGKPVALQSLWFAVDLTTGQFAVNAPSGFPLRQFKPSAQPITAPLDHLKIARNLVLAVIVRPGVGAWKIRVGDGGPADSDGVVNGNVDIDLTQLVPIGSTPNALKILSPQDTLLIVDQEQMDFMALHLI